MAQGRNDKQMKRKSSDADAGTMTLPSRRRIIRWGPESMALRLTGLKTAITAPMTSEQLEAYALHVRIEEITQKLKIDDIVPADRDRRSPSPAPQYDAAGRRVNKCYRRYREKLEDERHSLVQIAFCTIPNYCAPQGYLHNRRRRGMIKEEKVYIPAGDFPAVNFIGQLLGPRGRSLAEMNTQSGATIVIRGRESIKEGRGGRGRAGIEIDHHHHQDDDPLHCLIRADGQDKLDKAKALVEAVIETAVTTPEHANDRKRQQLRDLAVTNGTFRDDEGHAAGGVVLGVGGGGGYQRPTMVVDVVCRVCSSGGHIARECLDRKVAAAPWRRNPPWREANWEQGGAGDALDLAFLQFQHEIGVKP